MKILHISEVFAPTGGLEKYIIELLPLLASHGHQNVVIYRQAHPRTLAANGTPLYHVPYANDQSGVARVLEIVAQEQPTQVFLHDVRQPSMIAALAEAVTTLAYIPNFVPVCPGLAKYLRRSQAICQRPYGLGCVPNIYVQRCATAANPFSVARIMRETGSFKQVYAKLPMLVVASQYMRQLMVQNGFDPQRISILPPHFEEVQHLGEPQDDPPVALFSGRLEAEKGLPNLFRAMARLRSSWQLQIAGEGSREEEYRRLAERLGIDAQVVFLGWLSAEQLSAAYQRATLLVFPSIWPEPFGKVGIEALARGRPVVGFDVGGVSDWLKDGQNGYLVPVHDERLLAERIETLLTDRQLAAEFGRNGQALVADQYSPAQQLRDLEKIFTAVTH